MIQTTRNGVSISIRREDDSCLDVRAGDYRLPYEVDSVDDARQLAVHLLKFCHGATAHDPNLPDCPPADVEEFTRLIMQQISSQGRS
jgi:hypothetical protein